MRQHELDELQRTVDRLRREERAKVQEEIVGWPPQFLICHPVADTRRALQRLLHETIPGNHAVVHACADDRACLSSALPDIWVAVLHQNAGAIDGLDLGARLLRQFPRAEVVVCRTVERPSDAERAQRAGIKFVLCEADTASALVSIVQANLLYRKELPTRLIRSRVARRLTVEHGAELARLLSYAPTPGTTHQTIEELMTNAVRAAWEDAQGNASQAARLLGTNPNSLHRLIDRYGIPLPVFARGSGMRTPRRR